METSHLDSLYVVSSCGSLHLFPSVATGSFFDLRVNKKPLGVILLMLKKKQKTGSVWFDSRSLDYLTSGFRLPKQCQAWGLEDSLPIRKEEVEGKGSSRDNGMPLGTGGRLSWCLGR